jgi:hypothetical protein
MSTLDAREVERARFAQCFDKPFGDAAFLQRFAPILFAQ